MIDTCEPAVEKSQDLIESFEGVGFFVQYKFFLVIEKLK